MCGIAGIVGSPDRDDAVDRVGVMLEALRRRGPDGAGVETPACAVLGHRRLAIFDPSPAGRQPMSAGGRHTVFNGAIYNFRELRAQLENRGYHFRTRTDTEVLLHGYDAWGIDGLAGRLRGMFAFVLHDAGRRTSFLVRDRLGVKPLCYARRGRTLTFASTPAALHASGMAGEIADGAVAAFLEFGYVPEWTSIFSAVEKLPPASIGEWRDGEFAIRRYWRQPQADPASRITFARAVDEAEALLLESVALRLQADVPVGALLSGGIDSALVCWAIARLGADVTAFTVSTPGDPGDETAAAASTARRLHLQQGKITVDACDAGVIDELVDAYAEPFACSSAAGLLRVCRAARQEATVLLTGDGGDDLFLGYPEHRHFLLAARAARLTPKAAARLWIAWRGERPGTGRGRRAFNFANYVAGGVEAIAAARDGAAPLAARGCLGERLSSFEQAKWRPGAGRRALEDFLAYEHRTRFTGEYLTKLDGASMHHAVEARSPFLDQRLWEFGAALPFGVRLHRLELKAILREIARRRIGADVANAPKRGFSVPVQRWLAGPWRSLVNDALYDSLAVREGWIAPEPLQRWWSECRERAPLQIWRVAVLERWLRRQASLPSQPASAMARRRG